MSLAIVPPAPKPAPTSRRRIWAPSKENTERCATITDLCVAAGDHELALAKHLILVGATVDEATQAIRAKFGDRSQIKAVQ